MTKMVWYKRTRTFVLTGLFLGLVLAFSSKERIAPYTESIGITTTKRYEAREQRVQHLKDILGKVKVHYAGEDGVLQRDELVTLLREMGFEGALEEKSYVLTARDDISDIQLGIYGGGCAPVVNYVCLPGSKLEEFAERL